MNWGVVNCCLGTWNWGVMNWTKKHDWINRKRNFIKNKIKKPKRTLENMHLTYTKKNCRKQKSIKAKVVNIFKFRNLEF